MDQFIHTYNSNEFFIESYATSVFIPSVKVFIRVLFCSVAIIIIII